jgi:energy-coupling factor transport system permease protein
MTPAAHTPLAIDRRLPRAIHPGAWWLWALGLVAVATTTTDPLVLVVVIGVAGSVVAARRGQAPWAASFGLFLRLGLIVLVARVVAQVLLSGTSIGTVVVTLPSVPLPGWMAGLRLGGAVTDVALLLALADGLRLVTVLAVIGAANALADPRRLLAALPPALHEIGVVLVVASTFAPSLVTAVGRIRAARRLRGRPDRGLRGALTIAVPVLDDALDRAMALAAAMDARGYGRRSAVADGERRRVTIALTSGLVGLAIGVVALLDGSRPRPVGALAVGAGTLLCVAGLRAAGRGVERTRHRPEPWRTPETLTAASGALAALVATMAPVADVGAWLDGSVLSRPPVLVLAATLVALGPLLVTPRPPDHPRAMAALATATIGVSRARQAAA